MIDELGNRIKAYENAYRLKLPNRIPFIIRVDGKSFHSVLRHCEKPFDDNVKSHMDSVAKSLIEGLQGAVLAYVQSDEVSVLMINYSSISFDPMFDNNIQKLCSISASIATCAFNDGWKEPRGLFDSRVFLLPPSDVANYFIWRQKDAERNSIQMFSRSLYSHKEVLDKNTKDMQDMLFKRGLNWNDQATWKKRGRCAYKEKFLKDDVQRTRIIIDDEIPIFTQDNNFINKYVFLEEEKNGSTSKIKI